MNGSDNGVSAKFTVEVETQRASKKYHKLIDARDSSSSAARHKIKKLKLRVHTSVSIGDSTAQTENQIKVLTVTASGLLVDKGDF